MTVRTGKRVTIGLMIAGPIAYALWDYDVYTYAGNDATISILIRDADMATWGLLVPVLCFAAGICVGHWRWPIKPRPLSSGVIPMADSVTLKVVPAPAPRSLWTRFLAIGVAGRTKALAGSLNWTGGLPHWDLTKASVAGFQIGSIASVLLVILHWIATNDPTFVTWLGSIGVPPSATAIVATFGAICATLFAALGKLAALGLQGPAITTDPQDPAPHDGTVARG